MLPATNCNFMICEKRSFASFLCQSLLKRLFLMLALFLIAGATTFAQSTISVSVSPNPGGLTVGQAFSTLTATVTNDLQNHGVTWSATGGSFSLTATASGAPTTYTAPATAGVYTVTATSVTDVTKSASVTIGVTDLAGVFTYHNNLSRDGSNPKEYVLTPSNVTSTTFGKLFSCTVDGAIYAQPLWVANLTVGGVKRNVVFVATQHESLYAFDADVNTTPCTPLWHVSLIDATHGGSSLETSVPSGTSGNLVGSGYGDITPEVGVTGTPVIDPSSNTLYVVSKSVIASGPTFYQRLHAIDLTTGNEKSGSPVTIAGTYPGNGDGGTTDTFNPRQQNQRPGLALVNGIVYIAWASHEDHAPYYGWVMGYSASSLTQTAVLNVSPNVGYGGIWMGGGAPAADSSNNLYLITGNATFDATSSTAPNNDYGDSFLKLTSSLAVSQYFTPSDQANDNASDADFGSGGAAILVDQPSGPVQHLVIGGGKDGYLYLLNRDAMGGLGDSNAWQRFNFGNGIFATGAFWNDTFYMAGVGGHLQAFSFNTSTGKFNTSNVSQSSATYGFPGSTPSVSSSGTTNGIVWALNNGSYCTNQSGGCGPAVLYAYDSTNLATELWNSTLGTANTAGNAVKFTAPTVANGKVYVGTRGNNIGGTTSSTTIPGELDVYGLLIGATQAATPVISPTSQSFNPSIQVTITDSTSGVSIYYTTDGTNPTAASPKYASPFTLTTTSTVNAIAAGTGLLQSAEASATYALATQVATPTFKPAPGSYTAVQSVTISTTTPSATIYYTIDGTTPTTSSTKYTGPVSVGVTETLSAIAVASGLANSPVASGLYTINLGGVSSINFGSGFTTGSMALLGSTKLNGTALRLTDGGATEASAAWYNVPANIQNFTTDFTFLITPGTTPTADGFTFTFQGNNTSSIGFSGGGLGYGSDTTTGTLGIANSVAIKFDLYSNASEGVDSTGLYTNGASPTTPFVDMTGSGIDLHASHPIHAHIAYDGTNLAMSLTDTTTNGTFTYTWPINIPATVGGNTAYVGFTGGTGGDTAIQDIQTWTFASTGTQSPAATPTFSEAGGTYLGTQTISLSDTTAGASIFYTLDGTTPGTTAGGSTLLYSSPITVTSTKTINALATASGFSPSAVASATYTIESQVAAPTFSPAPGTYANSVTVTLSASTGATIYYTTDGKTTPTHASPVYSGAITLTSTTTIQAIAAQSGFFDSPVASGLYTINLGGVSSINFGSGFTAGSMTLNGGAALNGTRLRLTDAVGNEARSAWYNAPVNIQKFTTSFNFQITGGTNPTGDGFTFTIQGGPSTAVGPSGGGLGYGPDNVTNPSASTNTPIAKSVAVKFDLYSNAGEGTDSTGLYINGASPTTPFVDMTSSGVNLHTTDIFNVQMTYDGTNLTMVITDTTTKVFFTYTWPINISATVGGNAAYVGFTGGTGGSTAIQEITGWTMTSSVVAAATPVISPATGTYSSSQTVTITDATSGATIYYTTNGSQPITSSTKYTAAFPVSATTTVEAIAGAPGFATSATASAVITISTTKTPVVYRTATLPAVSSGPTFRQFTYAGFPDTTGTIIDATKVGDNVTFTVNVATPGVYDVKLSYKEFNTRGTSQLSINGTNLGATLDEYASTDSYATADYGTFKFATAGNYSFKFTVTGKNTASTSYTVSFDDITLTPQ